MRLKEITIEEWAESIESYPNPTLFHTFEWLKILRDGFSHIEIRLYKILNGQNRTIGLLPVEFARKGPLKLGGSPLPSLFTPYQGPLLLNSTDIALKEVPKLVIQLFKLHYLALSLLPDRHRGSQLIQGLANWELRKTFVVDLTLGIEQIWKNLKAETRNQVRQAERRGVKVYEPTRLDDWIDDYYVLHKAVYLRQKMKPPAKRVFYKAIWDHLYRKGQLRVILAKYGNKTIAGGIFPIYKDIIYFLDGASLREYQGLRANNLIQWNIISWAASEGMHFYDMVGANIPSIAHFKKGFGGADINYPYFQMTRGLLGKIGYQLYKRYRPMLKRLLS